MFKITIQDIANILNLGSMPTSFQKTQVENISINSKKILKNSLFVPIKGEKVDGHSYIRDAFFNGALASLCESDIIIKNFSNNLNKPLLKVRNTITALQEIATKIRSKFLGKVIGITGSCGKTTTKEYVSEVLCGNFNVFKTNGNYNGQIGVPLTLFKLDNYYDIAVIEMGISKFNEMDVLANIVLPDIAIITNIGHSHLEYLADLNGVFTEKIKVTKNFTKNSILFMNGNDNFFWKAKNLKSPYKIISFGINDTNLDFCALNIHEKGFTTVFDIVHKNKIYKDFRINAIGQHIVRDALAAIAVAFFFSISEKQIRDRIFEIESHSNRQSIKEMYKSNKNGEKSKIILINDTYNANPESMREAINVLSNLEKVNKKIAVLADMLEQGKNSRKIHEDLGEFISQKNINIIVTVGKDSSFITKKSKKTIKTCLHFDNINEAYKFLNNILEQNDAILFKGSRMFHLESLIDKIFT